MNKKFLSAILFGALMVTSTGTFVSCKDYDDDIENLQTQIDKNSSAIAELQKLVGQGKWVSSISSIENGFTVTMSDGSSHQIKGINGKDGADGKDGKNGTEWTIGEDGFWYVDGEKTENVAVAKDGKNGVTAPSPSIGADGNWIVYNWDEAKGEFVAEATEIPAAGTAAYAVEADGVYTLHIADENGEYQEIVLPATCEAFDVASPSPVDVDIVVEQATWGTVGRVKAEYDALVKAFPEIAELKKGDELTQGGELPLMISPAAVELDGTYSFSLVDMKGKVADIELSNPTKGIADDWKIKYGTMSRSANGEAGLWTLEVAPAYDAKKKEYASIEDGALMVTNAKGTTSRTAFAYFVSTDEVKNVNVIATQDAQATLSEEIDVLAAEHGVNKDAAIFTLENEYYGKYILEATSAIQVEKYDITIEGSKLMIGNMPANETEIIVNLKLTALGLNGSTDAETVNLKVVQAISAIELPAKEVTLSAKAQKVRWDFKEDLGLSAVEFDNFMATGDIMFAVTREADKDEDNKNEKYVAYYDDIIFYNAKGVVTEYADETWSKGEAVTFGFNVDALATATAELDGYIAEKWMPATYTVSLISKKGNTVIFKAETELEVKNPTSAAISLVPEFVENGVLQAVGVINIESAEPKYKYVVYDFEEGLLVDEDIVKNGITYTDMDFAEYKEAYYATNADDSELYDPEVMASNPWIINNELNVYSYYKNEAETEPAKFDCLEKVRNIRATYALFGNEENVETFDFQVVVKSAVYSEKPEEVVTITKSALTLLLTDNTDDEIDQTSVNLKKITTAVLACGPDAGLEYNLWNIAAGDKTITEKVYNKLVSEPLVHTNGNKYLADANNKYIAIDVEDMRFIGYSDDEVLKAQEGDETYYFAYERTDNKHSWTSLLRDIEGYSATINGKATKAIHEGQVSGSYVIDANVVAALKKAGYADEAKKIELFQKYSDKAGVKTVSKTVKVGAEPIDETLLNGEATIEFANEKTGDKFVELNGTTIKAELASDVNMTTATVDVPMYLVINDAWGKTMKVPFTITVKK